VAAKHQKKKATPICSEIAYNLRMHVTSLHAAGVDLSSDDDVAASSDSNDDFSPILFPPGFQPASMPPHGKRLVPLEKAGQQMIGQHTLFKRPTHGWCLGKISALNTNLKRCVNRQSTSLSPTLMIVALGRIVSDWTIMI